MGRISGRYRRCNGGGLNELLIEPADDADLSSMTKAELLEYAEANGIEGVNSSMRKADILGAVKGVA